MKTLIGYFNIFIIIKLKMADTGLFSRLRRLFSTDVLIRNVGGDQLKVMDVNQIQMSGELETNSLIDRFNRVYTNSPNSLYGQQTNFNYQTLRPYLYSEYDCNGYRCYCSFCIRYCSR